VLEAHFRRLTAEQRDALAEVNTQTAAEVSVDRLTASGVPHAFCGPRQSCLAVTGRLVRSRYQSDRVPPGG
jgi:hypothetical protein